MTKIERNLDAMDYDKYFYETGQWHLTISEMYGTI